MKENIQKRIADLRAVMAQARIDAVIIPQTDPHQGEYIASHWQVRRFLSGFTGSAGSLVVTADKALVWTDSRYFIQAADQLEGTGIKLMKEGLPGTPEIIDYLRQNLHAGATVGINGLLFPVNAVKEMAAQLAHDGIKLRADFDPVDAIWTDRPSLPQGPIFVHDIKYAGQSAADKIATILSEARANDADAVFISALDEVAWALNIRCDDVRCNPVATAYLYVGPGESILFTDPAKVDEPTAKYLADNGVTVRPYNDVAAALAALPADIKVMIEPAKTSHTVASILAHRRVDGPSAVAMHKAVKNATQIAGTREAMERDGVAMVKSLIEIEKAMADGQHLTEIGVDQILTRNRSQQDLYFDNSFETIAGFRAHGAIVHYSATPESDATLSPDGLLLIDSGAQYLDGTTDITRTITLGNPTPQQRRDFTLVMKGHIALGSMTFPAGTTGHQLDAIARQWLWREGLSYLHGTGHGVGHFLNVHEGPQSIRLNYVPTPLTPGMITSNEPGLYREGVHGIRCENLVLTVEAFDNEFGKFLRFETLTLCPFDLKLFDTSIMTQDEIDWLNNYHQEVYHRLAPRLNDDERSWLKANTAPLTK